MTPNLPAVIAELKRLKHACQVRDKWLREDSREEYTDALIEHDTTLIAAAEECADWERWAKEVLTDFRIPFDEHKVGIRLAFTQWMADQRKAAEECERLREALDEVTTCPTCNGEKVWTPECQGCLSGYGSCTCTTEKPMTCPQCDGSGRDFAGSDKARAALEGKT